jgi:hypothetical protein
MAFGAMDSLLLNFNIFAGFFILTKSKKVILRGSDVLVRVVVLASASVVVVPGAARISDRLTRFAESFRIASAVGICGGSGTGGSVGLVRVLPSVSRINLGTSFATSGLRLGTQAHITETLTSTTDHMKESDAYPKEISGQNFVLNK